MVWLLSKTEGLNKDAVALKFLAKSVAGEFRQVAVDSVGMLTDKPVQFGGELYGQRSLFRLLVRS